MTVQDDIQRAIHEAEDERMKRRASLVQFGVPLIAVLLALTGFLISAGGIQAQSERAKEELAQQRVINTELRKNDEEQKLMLVEIGVNLEMLMERNGVKYKRGGYVIR